MYKKTHRKNRREGKPMYKKNILIASKTNFKHRHIIQLVMKNETHYKHFTLNYPNIWLYQIHYRYDYIKVIINEFHSMWMWMIIRVSRYLPIHYTKETQH